MENLGYAAVKARARALLPNSNHPQAAIIFRGASLGVSEYEMRVTIASFGRYSAWWKSPAFVLNRPMCTMHGPPTRAPTVQALWRDIS